MAATDYIGRRVDLAVIRPQTVGAPVLQTLTADGGAVCVGVQKLAQRWLIEFLTGKGSVRYFPTRGCGFTAALRSGRLRTEADVFAAFLLARDEVANNLTLVEAAGDPGDERYRSAELTKVVVRTDRTVELTVRIVSQAGDSRKVILPVTVLPWRP